eukprot:CAMPEP_0194280194 /NCGR_PEP_ID=MMETSP0169-20130528/16207_1 /TAXON_ID=218684 /ORGANISM="Corethron pennatum, Strain L29A3" /LENGTH=306 /DNA_ID=CAMNT_0039024827 /DNA_START=61 /DNA_END=981 /DNA_ORIENTATION=-
MKYTNHVVSLFIGQFLALTIAGPNGPITNHKENKENKHGHKIQTTEDEEWIVANYDFDTSIQLRFSKQTSETSWVEIFKYTDATGNYTESLWMTFCGDQDELSCTPSERESGIVTIGAGGGIPNQMSGEQWPLNPDSPLSASQNIFYEACIYDTIDGEDEYLGQCLEFTISNIPTSAVEDAKVRSVKKGAFFIGDKIETKFNTKINYSNQWVGLFKKGKNNNPSGPEGLESDGEAIGYYTGCNSKEGDQGEGNYLCSEQKRIGTVDIDTTDLARGKYYLCLVFTNNAPYDYYKCATKVITLRQNTY